MGQTQGAFLPREEGGWIQGYQGQGGHVTTCELVSLYFDGLGGVWGPTALRSYLQVGI